MLRHGESKRDKIATKEARKAARWKGREYPSISKGSVGIDRGDHVKGVWKVAEKTEIRSREKAHLNL